MHILLIHQAFAALDEAGGTRHYEMAEFLAEKGHGVTIIASPVSYLSGKIRSVRTRWSEKENPLPGITIIRTFTYSGLHRSFFHRLISFFSFMLSSFVAGLRVGKVDVVWGTSPPIFQGFTAWLLARLKGAAFLFEVRDLWPAFAIAVGVLRNPLLIRASLWLEEFLYHRADRVMVNSPGFISHVITHGARWVELIPNGADPAMFDPCQDGDLFRREHDLTGKFVVLYAGAHGFSNNLGVILQAARELSALESIRFVLIGDGKEKNNLVTMAKDLGLNNVLFLPPIPKVQMPLALAAADACIAILKPLDAYKTTYPNKVFDYMAAGRAVILAIDGVIREVVESAGAGIFTPPGDPGKLAEAVRQLFTAPQTCRQMGLAGRDCVEKHFSRAQLSEKLQLVLEEMEKPHA
jgi:glycosyltransferase involved in cell wall biosynthesis